MTDRYENIRNALAMGPAGYINHHGGPNGGDEISEWKDKRASKHTSLYSFDPNTVRELLAERDALAREKEAMRRCAIRYLGWLGVTHKPLDVALLEDMADPDMCGDAAIAAANGDRAPEDAEGGGGKLSTIARQLRLAGASLPAPEVKGTPESGIITGLCIALALVEGAIHNKSS